MNGEEYDALFEQLRPVADLKVMDLVAEAGVDVGPWAIKHGGKPVAYPRANPHYCYEWAFGGNQEPIVLCVWHASLTPHSDSIAYQGNLRARATSLEQIVLDPREPSNTRSRAKSQAKRCDGFDFRVQRAFRSKLSVRVIILEGERADRLGHDSSKVSKRVLDETGWHVDAYDDRTGAFTILRGAKSDPESLPDGVGSEDGSPTVVHSDLQERFVDQFSVPRRREQTTWVVQRSGQIRRNVLLRAAGHCEYCGRAGFLMASGQVYLETHHVIPLCEAGPDLESNVVALCPEDHRRAHFGMDAEDIRRALLALLGSA